MDAKLICPNCGTEMKLPEKSTVVTGVTLSKETGGIHMLQADVIKNDNLNQEVKTMSKRDERMEILKGNGVDVNKYFNVTLPNGEVVKMTLKNGVPVLADIKDDEIASKIISDGYVRNSKLHRRWVMAQTFKMLNYHSYDGRDNGWSACMRNNYSYMYQFDMMLEEIRVISKLEKRDIDTFNERTSFFNRDVVVSVCTSYINDLKLHIDNLRTYKCKGVPYKKLGFYGDVFVDDLKKKIYSKMEISILRMKSYTADYYELYKELKKFRGMMIKLPYDTAKNKVWIEAFKGAGAYYTLKNLTMYHGCKIVEEKRVGWGQPKQINVYASGIEATNFVKSKLDEYYGEGWRYLAMLRKCIADNNFDFDLRMEEIYN